jgi:small subunit ribosomal protein S9
MAKTKKVTSKDTKEWVYSKGRRKTASSRVRLIEGEGESMVNEKLVGVYFPGEALRGLWQKPFVLTDTLGKYHFTARVVGGGKNGQLEAVIHGVARSLSTLSPDNRAVLKKAGLLTRDGRKRERRKVGTGGKARRAKQSPKR